MKRSIIWLLALTLTFTLTACGEKDTADMSSQEVSSSKATGDISSQESAPVKQQSVGSLTVVTDELGEEAEQAETLRGGTNQNDAVLLPLNTRMTGRLPKKVDCGMPLPLERRRTRPIKSRQSIRP